jgi:hypothetical protein
MDDINDEQSALVFAGANVPFGEVWWLYPSDGASECDSYVIYNALEDTWAFGTLARTVYVGDSDIFSNAYAMGADGYLYDHEYGVNADSAAINSYIESGDIEIGEGDDLMLIRKLVPDFKRITGSMSLTLKGRKYPQDTEQLTSGTETITSSTKFVNPRMRCRQIALRFASSAVDDNFRFGKTRVELRPYGKR